ncbi:MAG: YlxR family protein [Synergistaceae bacterium]|nr:YlxR family protein [Synergistaceae bacterium]
MGGSSEDLRQPRKRPRRCVGCGRESSKADLIRVARSPSGVIAIDSGRAPGRGAYVCANPVCLAAARKKNALTRALKAPVGPEIYKKLEELCVERTE